MTTAGTWAIGRGAPGDRTRNPRIKSGQLLVGMYADLRFLWRLVAHRWWSVALAGLEWIGEMGGEDGWGDRALVSAALLGLLPGVGEDADTAAEYE